MKFDHGSKFKITDNEITVQYENLLLLKPRVVVENNFAKVYRSELSNVSHKSILMKWLKEYARKIIEEKTFMFSKEFGIKFNRVAIRDQSTRWGSCSSHGNLNFSWRLVLTPLKCLEYVVIHELTHIKHMNHSRDFWNLMANFMPDYKVWDRWLRDNGHTVR